MVNGLSSGNGYNPQLYANATSFGRKLPTDMSAKDIENVVKYATGTAIVNQEEGGPFEGMGIMLAISGGTSAFAGGKWLMNAQKSNVSGKLVSPLAGNWFNSGAYKTASANIKNAWGLFNTEALAEKANLKANGGLASKSGLKYILNKQSAKTIMDAIPSAEKLAKLDATTQGLYAKAKKAAELAKANPANADRAFMVANKRLAQANAMAHGQIKPTGMFGKIGKFFGKITGFSKANAALKNFATKSPITAKILKHGKGNGIFLAITAGVELFTQVIPSFTQLGAKKGTKQLAKSTVKTGATVGGWVVGSAIGTKGGAMLGAAIGSVFPGVGTVIGGVIGGLCGFIGGCAGSWLAAKAANKVVGKNELEIAKEQQAKEITKQAQQDPQAIQELITQAEQRLAAEGAETEDARLAFGSLTKLKQSTPEQTQPETNVAEPATTTTPAVAPSFQGNYNQYASNPFGQVNYMDQDFMAMSAGLV